MLRMYEVDAGNVVLYLPLQSLTTREIELLQHRANGYDNHETAKLMALSFHTVRNQLQVAYQKLGVNDIAACVAIAMRQGWVR